MSKERVVEILRDQYGVLSRAQAVKAGLSPRSVDRRLATGRWESVLPGVYRAAGVPGSWHQSVRAACLWAGDDAFASHRTAAALWGLDDSVLGEPEISTTRRVRHSGIIVHVAEIPNCDRASVASIPTTGVARTLFDLGAVTGRETVEAALDDALRRRLTSFGRLTRRLEDLGGRGRRGAAVLRSLLEVRDPKNAPPDSVLEARLIRVLRRANLPEPSRQFEVREKGKLLARVDLAYPDLHLAIEADGYRYHSGWAAWQRDLERRNRLTSRGWRVIHVTWADITSGGKEIVTEIRRALGERGQLRLG
jgi:very-short-patch-repair endonuclease/predicted transcriptional regulator of viral defense system